MGLLFALAALVLGGWAAVAALFVARAISAPVAVGMGVAWYPTAVLAMVWLAR